MSLTSATVAAGGFSSKTCLPASRHSTAMVRRGAGGVQSDTASRSRTPFSMSLTFAKDATPLGAAPLPRFEMATSSKSAEAAIAGACWSRAILPNPTIPILYLGIR